MKVTNPAFSEKYYQMKNGDKANTQESVAADSFQESEERANTSETETKHSFTEKTEDDPVTMSKDTPAKIEVHCEPQPPQHERVAAEQPTLTFLPAISQERSVTGSSTQQAGREGVPTNQKPVTGTSEFQQRVQWNGEQVHEREQAERMQQVATLDTQEMVSFRATPAEHKNMSELPTVPLPTTLVEQARTGKSNTLTRERALLLILLLIIIAINATNTGFGQFFGPQGWGSVFSNSGSSGQNLLNQLNQQLHQPTSTPGAGRQPTSTPLAPTQLVNKLLANMTLDQKLGQMIMVRFNTSYYSSQLDTMITQYHVGSVIEYQSNIGSQSQLNTLNNQIQHSGDLPIIISVDQEGGTVDRLINLDGPQPSATEIGATGNPQVAYQQGLKDARDLASYGFNFNLAPDVDVHAVYNTQLVGRTYGTNPTIVSQMAGAYLDGLQQSGKVLGAIKHFPGLGDTSTDPHYGLPSLARSLNDLNAIDWAPYKTLLSKGNVYAVMVTHEIVKALDPSTPSSLSPKVVGILRQQLGFQGVIVTDGLTMGGITDFYTLGQAAVMAVQAGDDLLMDPSSPDEVAQMINGLKQALSSGTLSQQRIDESVRRILLLKYQMGLLRLHS